MIFIPSEDNKPKRSTSSKKVSKVVSITNVKDVYDRGIGNCWTTKDHKAYTKKAVRPLGINLKDQEGAWEPRRAQKVSQEVSTIPKTHKSSLSFTESPNSRPLGG